MTATQLTHDFMDNADEEPLLDFDSFKRKNLVVKKVLEKRYDNDNHEIFQYELKCYIEDANQEQAVYQDQERANPDRAVFLNFARLAFQGNALLGFKTNSLQVSISNFDFSNFILSHRKINFMK